MFERKPVHLRPLNLCQESLFHITVKSHILLVGERKVFRGCQRYLSDLNDYRPAMQGHDKIQNSLMPLAAPKPRPRLAVASSRGASLFGASCGNDSENFGEVFLGPGFRFAEPGNNEP